MAAEVSIQAAVGASFGATVEYTTADPDHPGCLLSGVAPATDSPGVHSLVQSKLRHNEAHIAQRLAHAVERGELPAGYSPGQGAGIAADAMLALALRARIGTPRGQLAADAARAAEMVLQQPAHYPRGL